jgi:hypothetical protein
MQKEQNNASCATMGEQITVNRADIKRLHDSYLAQVHILREMLQLPPLNTAHRRQTEMAKISIKRPARMLPSFIRRLPV